MKADFIARLLEVDMRVENGGPGFVPFLADGSDITFTNCTVAVAIREGAADRIRSLTSGSPWRLEQA